MKMKPTTCSCTTWVEVAEKIEMWLPKYHTVTDEDLAALIKPLFSDLHTMAALADMASEATTILLSTYLKQWCDNPHLLDEVA